jgi:hypothetical protein
MGGLRSERAAKQRSELSPGMLGKSTV